MNVGRSVALALLGTKFPHLADWLSDAPPEVAKDLNELMDAVREAVRETEKHPDYVTITNGMRGSFAVHLTWNEDRFYEPVNSGMCTGRNNLDRNVIVEAIAWAKDLDVEYRGPALEDAVTSKKRTKRSKTMKRSIFLVLALAGCGGDQFTTSRSIAPDEPDATSPSTGGAPGTGGKLATGGAVATGGQPETGGDDGGAPEASTGGASQGTGGSSQGTGGSFQETGGSSQTGGASSGGASGSTGDASDAAVPQPRCCVDADCPSDVPFCSPWGTCYQGGDPYNCDYDVFCNSFCVHCLNSVAGACEAKRCVCS